MINHLKTFAIGGGGAGTPGGSDRQVQFNDGGVFGGDSAFTFNKTTNVLTLGGPLNVSFATSGGFSELFLENSSANANSHADLYIQTAGVSAGDPEVVLSVSGGGLWSMGLDNSDNDYLKFGLSATVGSSTQMVLTDSGALLNTGYLRVGSISAPTNTTAGDLTVVRLKVGDGSFGSGVDASVTGDGAFSGFLNIGSETVPTNTTAGDLTSTRLKVGDGDFGTGVDASVTGDGAISGFLRVGSETAPTNTTAGDLTITRLNISDNVAFSSSGRILRSLGTMTATAGTEYYWFVQPSLTPASNSSASFRLLGFDGIWNPSTGVTQSAIFAGFFQMRIRGDGLITSLTGLNSTGMVVDSSSTATVQATTVQAIAANIYSRPSGTTTATVATAVGYDVSGITTNGLTTTDFIGVRVQDSPNVTATNYYGIQIITQTRGTTLSKGIELNYPRIGSSITSTTSLIGLDLPTASLSLGNQTGTTTNAHGISIGIPTWTSTTNTRTITNAAGLYIAGGPIASTNITLGAGAFSVTRGYTFFGDAGAYRFDTAITQASATSATLDVFSIPADTITVTGTTQITTATGFNLVNIGRPTYTDSSAVTIDQGATVYIANSPLAAGSVTLTNAYSIWVDAGITRLDGDLDHRGTNLGFFGVTPTTRQTELTDELTTITFTAPGTPDYAIQDLTNAGGFGFVTKDEGNTALSVIANLQVRVNELETKLTAYGLLQDAD